MKHNLSSCFGIIVSTPAVAEVCDKVRPLWDPEDGPIDQFNSLVLFFSEPLGLTALALVAVSVLIRRARFTAFAVTIVIIIIALNGITWLDDNEVLALARSEGCLAPPILTSIVLVAIAFLLVAANRSTSRAGSNTPAP